MNQSITTTLVRQSTPCATLVALGLKVQQLDLFHPIHEQVHIGVRQQLEIDTVI